MNQKRMPIIEALENYKKKKPLSFHVPGHKNGLISPMGFDKLFQYDVTELTGLDDLHSPTEAIAEAQELLSDHYNSEKSYFLVNGSTVGNLAMILAICEEDDVVFVQRNCHKSILNGLMLAKVQPIFLEPEWDPISLTPIGISLQTLQQAFREFPNCKSCIFTYPTYYGMTYELKLLIEEVHNHGGLVLVDEAHGPHFTFTEVFPKSSIDLGADITVQSAHKMLPSMTMGSYLHVNNKSISYKRIEYFLSILQSSSPSYLIMASLDFARAYLATYQSDDLTYTLNETEKFKQTLVDMNGRIKLVESHDPLKILLRYEEMVGYELLEKLEEQGVYCELADPYQVLMILPLLKNGAEHSYIEASQKINAALEKVTSKELKYIRPFYKDKGKKISTLSLTYREVKARDYKWIDLDKAIGQVSAKMITPYPPGIPLFIEGEEITRDSIEYLKLLLKLGAKFQGEHLFHEKKIAVLN
ncbi:arginine/lysine/ornithine decarboxylase [Bacillus pakistanensis]|uniref:Arginine/lysine/ornithine decarboxylase n=1 Tax=Rossellomorea pakistanensis TaxID=992288 RepID=A0ABS2NJX0_9BACI|nr:decarboxylase [Bacillus pakistanensis]MBM7588163.1 arginine/lysine/ornithine decarboxylase [Bacillus pakistanensis]